MRHHRGQTRTISFRISGKALEALERRAEEFKASPGEYSRAVVDGHLNNAESRRIVELIEALSEQHERLSEILCEQMDRLAEEVTALRQGFNCEQMERLIGEVTALRRDFNVAVGHKI